MQGTGGRERRILAIGGADREQFLQNLVTNDLGNLSGGLVYSALLTPQGKYLADFFLQADGDRILLDVDASLAGGLAKRLAMYRLRADVSVSATSLSLQRGLNDMPDGAFPDPRAPSLGWRRIAEATDPDEPVDWDSLRVAACVPETGIELIPNESYILECGFERLNGVDFRKGCYVGQEITARMKHKTDLKKGLASVSVDGSAPVGTEILVDGRSAGTLFTQSGGRGIAFLRFDRANGPMRAGTAKVTWTR